MLASQSSIISLDVGGRRIGVAIANAVARLATPLTTLQNNDETIASLQKLIQDNSVAALVIGLPRNMHDQDTDQTREIRAFADKLQSAVTISIYWQDEALTSQRAEAELQKSGKPYQKADIDAHAAMYILEDFLTDHPEVTA